jgi:hypothetical protein
METARHVCLISTYGVKYLSKLNFFLRQFTVEGRYVRMLPSHTFLPRTTRRRHHHLHGRHRQCGRLSQLRHHGQASSLRNSSDHLLLLPGWQLRDKKTCGVLISGNSPGKVEVKKKLHFVQSLFSQFSNVFVIL